MHWSAIELFFCLVRLTRCPSMLDCVKPTLKSKVCLTPPPTPGEASSKVRRKSASSEPRVDRLIFKKNTGKGPQTLVFDSALTARGHERIE